LFLIYFYFLQSLWLVDENCILRQNIALWPWVPRVFVYHLGSDVLRMFQGTHNLTRGAAMRLIVAMLVFAATTVCGMFPCFAGTGTISGTLRDSNHNPIAGFNVSAYTSKQQGGGGSVASTQSDSSGVYTLTNVPEGSIYLQAAGASASKNYQWTYWDGKVGSTNYNESVPIPVTSGGSRTGIDMTLQAGGALTVTFANAAGNPVSDMSLLVYPGSACNGSNLPSYPSSGNTVTAYGLPPGTVYLKPWTNNSSNAYMLDWWSQSGSTSSCSNAGPVTITAGQTTGPLAFTLIEGSKITGKVTNGAGTGLPDLSVAAYTGSPCGQTSQVAYANTDSNGDYSLVIPPATPYYVRVNDYNTRSYMQSWWNNGTGSTNCSAATTLTGTLGTPVQNINFTMQTGGSISGTVTDANNTGVSGVVVQAYDAAGYSLNQATTNASGAYTITNIPAGYALVYADGTANSNNYLRKWWDGATGDINRYRAQGVNGDGATAKTGVNFSLEAGGTVSGVITGPSGAALSGASVRAYPGAPVNNYSSMTSTTTNASGAYTLKGMPGQVYVQAYAASSGVNAVSTWWTGTPGGSFKNDEARPVTVAPNAPVTDINLQAAAGGTVSGVVRDGNGNPLASKSVTVLTRTDCGTVSAGSTSTDSNGAFSVIGVPAGDAYVRASGGSYEPVWWTASGGTTDFANAETVAVTAGQTKSGLVLALPAAGSISGTITDATSGTPLYGVSVFAIANACPTQSITKYVSTVTAVDGSYTLNGVAPGTQYVWTGSSLRRTDHAVTWHSNGTGASDCHSAKGVVVTAGNTSTGVNMSLPHGGILSGRLTSPAGAGRSCAQVRASRGSACSDGTFIVSEPTRYDGTFTLYGLPAGSAYIAAGGNSNQHWQYRFWNGTTGVAACTQAGAVNVINGATITDVNMVLPPMGTITPCLNLLMPDGN
jgi:hypothetical protein